MNRLLQPRLAQLFLQSLAAAAAACSPASVPESLPDTVSVDLTSAQPTAVANVTATPEPTSTAAAIVDPEDPIAYAKQFKPIDTLAKAFPVGTDLVGFVDNVDGKTTCTPAPCSPAWKPLMANASNRVAVVKRDGNLELMRLVDFPTVIGKVDSAEKAALRVRLDDYRQPGTCADFRTVKYECASRSATQSIAARKTEEGYEVATFGSRDVCTGGAFGRVVTLGVVSIDEGGELSEVNNAMTDAIDRTFAGTVECHYPTKGRMFEGFEDLPPETCELEYYVRSHRHEAAAVFAFERLARELAAHGAPRELVEAALVSAEDEARHASLFRARAEALSARIGVECALSMPAPNLTEVRSLEAILEENAIEGCANETYAALVATHQSMAAPSASLRALLTEIAADEREHAALAHAVHAWGLTVLAPQQATALEAHRRVSARALRDGAARTAAGELLGEPAPELARLAFDMVDRALALRAA